MSDSPSQIRSVNKRLDFGRPATVQTAPIDSGLHTPDEEEGEEGDDDDDDSAQELPNEDAAPLGDDDDAVQSDDPSRHDDQPEDEAEGREESSVDPDEESSQDLAPVEVAVSRTRKARSDRPKDRADFEDEATTASARAGVKRSRALKGKGKEVAVATRKLAEVAEEEEEESEEEEQQRQPKRQRREAKRKQQKEEAVPRAEKADSVEPSSAAPKKRGRKPKAAAVDGDTSIVVPRGPPLPKKPGLVINRREVPGLGPTTQTRSGRTSFRPLAFWRNEHVDYDQGEVVDDAFAPKSKDSRFLLPAIKGVHRVVEEAAATPRPKPRGRRKGGAAGPGRPPSSRPRFDEDEADPVADAWEVGEGMINGQVQVWEPEWEFNPLPSDEDIPEEERLIALSHERAVTHAVKGATFDFAKVLSTPFFGAGVIDLKPGAAKRPKNSRNMHLVFFVFTGRVAVQVSDTQFRISKGGMWFVPRGMSSAAPLCFLSRASFGELTRPGNYYSIENDYDEPARLFFAQGCERFLPVGEGDEPEPDEPEPGQTEQEESDSLEDE